jgi:protoporphyrinogen oxidase
MAKDKNARICIIGGGPAGISAAYYLQLKGYKDITVLERLDRLGGKCDSPVYKDKHYEMGAIMGVPNYHTIYELMAAAGLKADGPKLDREFRDARSGKLMEGISKEEMPELMAQMKRMGELLATKYAGYKKPGMLGKHPDLKETFMDFCTMNGVPLVMKLWINPYTAFGYGYFNLVPAAYVLQYLDWETMNHFLNVELITWKDGTQTLWERLALLLGRAPRMCTKISKVVREGGKVYVYSNYGKEEFDELIVTSPLQDFHCYADATEEEAKLFSKIKTEDYKVLAATVKKYPEISGYMPANMFQSRAGHVMVYYHRWPKEPEQVVAFYVLGDPQEKIGEEECKELIIEDAKTLNVEVKDIVMYKSWRYFPHVNANEMKHGWYEKLEGMQGQRNTYWAGEIMSFSDMEETASYSKQLVERFF